MHQLFIERLNAILPFQLYLFSFGTLFHCPVEKINFHCIDQFLFYLLWNLLKLRYEYTGVRSKRFILKLLNICIVLENLLNIYFLWICVNVILNMYKCLFWICVNVKFYMNYLNDLHLKLEILTLLSKQRGKFFLECLDCINNVIEFF